MITSQSLLERQVKRRLLYRLAQEGDEELLEFFREAYNLKIYTNEELVLLNRIRGVKKVPENIISVKDQEKVVVLPMLSGQDIPAQINWIEDIGDGYFRAGLTLLAGYPYDGGSTEWVLKLDPKEGFKPMFCSLYWD